VNGYWTLTASPSTASTFTWKPPEPADDAVRIVRWGLADVLRWLGENVGPRPGDPFATVSSWTSRGAPQ
jgi:hypothetical protein